jgi:hypothetical protein
VDGKIPKYCNCSQSSVAHVRGCFEGWEICPDTYALSHDRTTCSRNHLDPQCKCGKEIGRRVANEGWMTILPEQFKLCDAEGYRRGMNDAADMIPQDYEWGRVLAEKIRGKVK